MIVQRPEGIGVKSTDDMDLPVQYGQCELGAPDREAGSGRPGVQIGIVDVGSD